MSRPCRLGRRGAYWSAGLALAFVLAGCTSDSGSSSGAATDGVGSTSSGTPLATGTSPGSTKQTPQHHVRVAPPFRNPIPGMPPEIGNDVYAGVRKAGVAAAHAHDPAYLYVPSSYGAPITTVIDQRTHKIVRVLHTGTLSQHVTPSWDLKTLYVEASEADRLVAINPRTGRVERRIPVPRPYNLYFTPDGKQAIVMSEENDKVIFTDPHTFKPEASVSSPSCQGPNHADFSANGRFFVLTCEFSGSLLRVSTLGHRVTGRLDLGPGSKPQDVRLSPDGRTFYVADMGRNRLVRINWRTLRPVGHTPMPAMPHGIYFSRDEEKIYVSDRMAGEVSVVSVATNKIVDTWKVPGGGSPDMGGLSADGKTLWLSGRYNGEVYGWNTRTGKFIARIQVGGSPHGLLVWPQPGRYSLGHTGSMR